MSGRPVRASSSRLATLAVLALLGSLPAMADDADQAVNWLAIELNGKPVEGPTLKIADNRVTGTGGCNRFTGPIVVNENAIKIGPVASTKMLCSGKAEVEADYFAALEQAQTYSIEGDSLTLISSSGSTILKFKK